MNNGPGIVLVALTVVWVSLLLQRRRGPRVMLGVVLIVVQIVFAASYLNLASDYIQLIEGQDLFLKKAKQSLKAGDHAKVLNAINVAINGRDEKASARIWDALNELDRSTNAAP